MSRIRRMRDYCECSNPASVGYAHNAICSECHRIEQWNKEQGLGWKDMLNPNWEKESHARLVTTRMEQRIEYKKDTAPKMPAGALCIISGHFRHYILPLKYDKS